MLGEIVDVSQPCGELQRIVIQGKHVKLVPWELKHTEEFWQFVSGPENDEPVWKYWPVGPYPDYETYAEDYTFFYDKTDPLFWAAIDLKSGQVHGQAVLGEVDPNHRNIEAGMFMSTKMQKTIAATEAFYLIASHAFDLGYRRLAWKTSGVNWPSRRAAERFGYTFEGIFRQHKIEKGRNRDSAWYSIIDSEWPIRKLAFEKWLDPSNFDSDGKQKTGLVAIRKQLEAEKSA